MRVADIQRFCMHDGPGVRTTIFLKGCPLRCKWCHNPETHNIKSEILFYENKCIGCAACTICPNDAHVFVDKHAFDRTRCLTCGKCAVVCPTRALEFCGKNYTAQELLEVIKKDSVFYGDDGGVTISGGEPFMQSEELISFLRLCKENGIHTVIETCGYFPSDTLKYVVPLTDLFLWDIKDTNSERHKEYTGVSNEQILENLFSADFMGAKIRVRCILINGINTDQQHYENLVDIVRKLAHCEGVEFLAYHSYGASKGHALSIKNVGNNDWIPSKEQVSYAKECLLERGIRVFNKN